MGVIVSPRKEPAPFVQYQRMHGATLYGHDLQLHFDDFSNFEGLFDLVLFLPIHNAHKLIARRRAEAKDPREEVFAGGGRIRSGSDGRTTLGWEVL